MAEALVSGIVTKLGEFLVTKLGDFVIGEAGSLVQGQSQIQDDVEFIKRELSTMEAFLREAEWKSIRDDSVREWVAQVRDEAYKVEDVLEEFIVRMLVIDNSIRGTGFRHLVSCISSPCFLLKQFFLRRQFHTRMETIRRELQQMYERRKRYNLEGIGTSSSREDEGYPIASYPFEEEVDIIGIDKDVQRIQEWLTEEHHHRLIVSVVGDGGSGKTTLIKRVYNNIKGKFDCDAWICVSQDFKRQQNLQQMLTRFHESRREVVREHANEMNTEDLVRRIHSYLEGKRYLLVLDDVWDAKVWEAIKSALPRKGEGKVIFTTRFEAVTPSIDEFCEVHHMDPLTQELAWELFCKKAFRNSIPQGCCPDDPCPPYLRQTGRALVEKCEGLPLAVVAIGGLMSKRSYSLSEWDDVLENLDWELNHNPNLEKLSRVLLTSYNFLPPRLKYCFLYCGLFPEDYEIQPSRLIRVWVAEGLVETHPRKTLEELANEYLSQLVDRSFLQIDNNSVVWGGKRLRMHDLVRDIAIHMMEKEEFGEILDDRSNNIVLRGQRRVAIQSNELTVQYSMVHLNTRSFQTFVEINIPYETILRPLLSNLKRLRVLELSGIVSLQHLPSEVGELVHLRYLSIRGTRVSEIPISLQNLYNLQTLDVRGTRVESFPQGMLLGKLPQLRHLLLKGRKDFGGEYFSFQNLTIDPNNLINLQALSGARADESLIRQLDYLTGLRKLSLEVMKGQDSVELCSRIKKMRNLRVLEIEMCSTENECLDLETMSPAPRYIEKLYLEGTIKGELPSWIGSLDCLRSIHLWSSKLKEDPMSTLSKLPSLEILFLCEAYTGRKMSWGDGCMELFPRLKTLAIGVMLELEELSEIKEGTMPHLVSLFIKNCPKLKKIPHGLQHLKALKYLFSNNMNEDFNRRLRPCEAEGDDRKGGEDHWLIHHIPFVAIKEVDGELESIPTVN